MKTLILEDETLAAERLRDLLQRVSPDIVVIEHLKTVESAIQWLLNAPAPDLILADIRLLDGLSFDIFSQVPVSSPVIFTTAYDQYAIRAFEVNSVDYLLKPVDAEKLQAAIDKVKSRVATAAPSPDYNALVKLLQQGQPAYKTRFMIRLGQKIIAVPVERVAYFFSENKLTYIVTTDQKKYPVDQTLDDLEGVLDPRQFFRVNRQFIVTFPAIAEIHPYFKGRVSLVLQPAATEEVIISAERTPTFKKWIDQ